MLPGEVYNQYRVEEVLHRGTKHVVVAATDTRIGRHVAIKSLAPALVDDPEAVARMMGEARVAARLSNPRIVEVYELGSTTEDRLYMTLELARGETLAQFGGHGPVAPAVAVGLALQICEAASAIHTLEYVHRNIEPTNLIVTRTTEGLAIKLIDLFFARQLGQPSFAGGRRTMIGRPPFAAPEQLRDATTADERSDVWSIGVVLATLIASESPFRAPSFAELVARMLDGASPALAPAIPAKLAPVIRRCLAADPSARYASANELAVALRGSL